MNSRKKQRTINPKPVATKDFPGNANTSYRRRFIFPVLLFFVVAFLIYGPSINYGYVLDDEIVITKNSFVQAGTEGLPDIFGNDSFLGYFQKKEDLYLLEGGRYRPLSLATFAIEISLFGPDRPDISHFINILLYALTTIFFWRIFLKLSTEDQKKSLIFSFPFVAALIWLFHPLHTECVANIKGRDEILALLGALAALWAPIKFLENKKTSWLVISGIFLFLGLLAKENAITFLAIIPLTLWFFRKVSVRSIFSLSIPLAIASFLFMIARYEALGYLIDHGKSVDNLMNDPFLGMNISEKYATIFYTLGWYLKLLFVPYPLTHDYYPYHVAKMQFSDISVILSIAIYLVLFSWALIKIKHKSIYAYSILFFLITLSIVSNLFVSVGTFMNERFLYMPSIGFAISVSYFLTNTLKELIPSPGYYKKLLYGISIVIASTFAWISINRIKDWKDPLTLDSADIQVSGNSARANCFFAVSLFNFRYVPIKADTAEKRKVLDSIDHYLDRAIAIYPDYESAWHMKSGVFGGYYELDKDADKLLVGLEQVMKKASQNVPARDYTISYVRYLIQMIPEKTAAFCYTIGYDFLFKEKKDPNTALLFLQPCLDFQYYDRKLVNATAEVIEATGDSSRAESIRKLVATN